jgi:hypothetical protein
MEFVVGQLGASVELDALEASVKAVELAHGTVEYWRVDMPARRSGCAGRRRSADRDRPTFSGLAGLLDRASENRPELTAESKPGRAT